jgi:drug/metabolite transporter (DMT)-like permease
MTARAWGALATLYVVWGSTYLGIMLAIRTLPPFLMSSARFLVAGAFLFALSPRRVSLRAWAAALVAGGALLTVGNGGITWAEQRVDSGVAALLVATMPLWLALFDRLVFGRRLSAAGWLGLLVGLGGVALLVSPGGGRTDFVGGLVCVASAAAWAAGSLYSRHTSSLPSEPALASGMEMLAGGVLLGVAGLAAGEGGHVQLSHVSVESLVALAYLVVVGSIVAFSCFHWLLRNAPTSIVSTYAYVNPVVAVLLGAAFLGEPLTLRTLIAGAAIVVSVVLIVGGRVRLPRLRALVPARGTA